MHWWKCKLGQLLWKTIWQFHKRLKIELLYDPKILLTEFYVSKRIKSLCPYEILYTHVYNIICNIPKALTVQMPINT